MCVACVLYTNRRKSAGRQKSQTIVCTATHTLKNDACAFAYVSDGVRTQGTVKGFEKVGSVDYFSNAPKMQGGFNFEFLNAASALERVAEALQRESARIIPEIWISSRCSNIIDHITFVQDSKLLGQNCQVAGTS